MCMSMYCCHSNEILCQVWQKHKENLILMERYHYFASSCEQFGHSVRSLSELMLDERESDGALATILDVLKRIHTIFFDSVGFLSTWFYHVFSFLPLLVHHRSKSCDHKSFWYLIICPFTSVGCWNRSLFTGCKTGKH
jgi:hypothetical protein